MLREYLNPEEFKIAGEIPLLMNLRLKRVFGKNKGGGGRTLVIDTCLIGDFVATLPALRHFIEAAGEDVDLVVAPPLKSIAESIRGVQRVFTARSIYNRNIENHNRPIPLPNEYSRVLVLRISPDAASMLKGVQCTHIATYDVAFLRYWAHVIWSVARKKDVRQWRDVNFEIIGMKGADSAPDFEKIFHVSEAEYARVRELLATCRTGKRVMIHTGSGWHVKLWDNDNWRETINKIHLLGDFEFIFVGQGDLEARSFDYIQKGVDFRLHSFVNQVDLKTTLLMMRLCDVFIGIDSGPRNMAHLADLRSITLLGPAPKNFMPTNCEDIVIDKFTCRCKSLYYFHKVSAIHSVSPDEIVGGFKKLLRLSALEVNRSRN